MRKTVFVLGTYERKAVRKGELLTDFIFQELDRIAQKYDLDASLVFAVTDPWFASSSKTEIGIERIRAERARVLEEISLAQPELVILFGPVAAASVFDHGSLTEGVLQRKAHYPFSTMLEDQAMLPADRGPAVYYTSSLEQIRMAPGMLEWWELDIAAAVKGYDKPVIEGWTMDATVASEQIGVDAPSTFGFDIETTGLDPWASNAAIRMGVLSWYGNDPRDPGRMHTFVFDWEDRPRWVDTYLRDPAIRKVGANIAFDVKWCARFGVEVANYEDVLTLEHVLCPGNPRLTLKDLGFKYYPQVGNYHEAVYALAAKFDDDWSKIPAEEMYEYCAADGMVSIAAWTAQNQALAGNAGAALLVDLYPLLTNMTIAGARIDRDVNMKLDELYTGKMAQLRGEITQVLGPINLNSPDQLAKALKEAVPGIDLSITRIRRALGDDATFRHKGSANGFAEENEEVSTDRATLEREAGKHPVIKTILEFRKLRTRHSTFIEGLREKHLVLHAGMHWIHPDFRSDVTDTYRLSSRNPNGQNMPRNEKDAEMSVKRQFVSRYVGGKIVEADMSQIELRVAAWFTGDQKLRDALLSGDVHREMAAVWMAKSPVEVTEDERQRHKPANFLTVYGGGANKLSGDLKITKQRASALIKQFFHTYTSLESGIAQVHRAVERNLSVVTPFGFRRQFFPPEHWRSADGFQIKRQAWNTIIQNTAAGLMYCAMIRYQEIMSSEYSEDGKHGLGVPILQIHDSLVVDCPAQAVDVVARTLHRAFVEAPIVARRYGVDFDMPLDADVKVGDNWGETTKLTLNEEKKAA